MKKLVLAISALVLTQTAQAEIRGYSCLGTEPFWSVEVKGQTLKYAAPGEEFKTWVSQRKDAAGMSEGYVSVYRNPKKDIALTIVEAKCTDGMSDNEYSKTMVLIKQGSVLYGCCEPLAQHDD